MFVRLAIVTILSVSGFFVTTIKVHAHGGGLESPGCHHDRKNGGYQCYHGPLAGHSFASQDEMLTALEALNKKPKDHPIMV